MRSRFFEELPEDVLEWLSHEGAAPSLVRQS